MKKLDGKRKSEREFGKAEAGQVKKQNIAKPRCCFKTPHSFNTFVYRKNTKRKYNGAWASFP